VIVAYGRIVQQLDPRRVRPGCDQVQVRHDPLRAAAMMGYHSNLGGEYRRLRWTEMAQRVGQLNGSAADHLYILDAEQRMRRPNASARNPSIQQIGLVAQTLEDIGDFIARQVLDKDAVFFDG
jgi:hypothetical protein